MPRPEETQVLIAGAGPVGLTAAIELARRGIDCRIVDPLPVPPLYAKAVGVQPRSLEVFESMGILGPILDAAVPIHGQLVYVNGVRVAQVDFDVPADVPFGFVAIPQYATERILGDELAARGVRVERGWRLTGFDQDSDGVTATLSAGSERTVSARYLVGADGAHSMVRKALGLTFEGGAFAEQYMLGDVEVDWSLPRGYAIRAMHQTGGTTDDLLVCIPLPSPIGARADADHRRYRMSMLVPDELGSAPAAGVVHGFEAARAPELHHIQAVLDRLSPEPATARNLRWSSVFRISHRLVDTYRRGRVFVAGDAAHIHPPTGAQGMNTGIQDAHNLAWKLALAVSGAAAPDLLDSYDAERRPVGEDVVGRTVRSARDGIGADSTDPQYVIRREAQLLIDYADSPIVAAGAGRRANDAAGLVRDTVTGPLRLFQLFGRHHTTLLYAGPGRGAADVADFERAAATAMTVTGERMTVYLIAAPDADVTDTALPLVRDADGQFARAYGCGERGMFVVRPDGYLGFTAAHVDAEALAAHLRATFAR
ncbi:pentachlorophenol monooxygenase [Mycobacterium sp. GA-1199]|uniref:FAD-dependent monooxygenase n=1 Tax=Mycobacterium sp. GA-1199 TaxID=1772287 RepID=UPI00074851A5|nr:FAD-dependent monooxygenase [Mycobacterium sp. GA-1199]KUI47742.1 pentachlorophenol monooxygenase [Mycobacterium sp. GA-1199]